MRTASPLGMARFRGRKSSVPHDGRAAKSTTSKMRVPMRQSKSRAALNSSAHCGFSKAVEGAVHSWLLRLVFLLRLRHRRERGGKRIAPDVVVEPVLVLLHHRALLPGLVDGVSETVVDHHLDRHPAVLECLAQL